MFASLFDGLKPDMLQFGNLYRIGFIFIILASSVQLLAQEDSLSNQKFAIIHNRQINFELSQYPIIQSSFQIYTQDSILTINPGMYHIYLGHFSWTDEKILNAPDSLSFYCQFRVASVEIHPTYQLFDSSQLTLENRVLTPIDEPAGSRYFTSRGVEYSGSFTRGVAVGNRQDLVLNSNVDLQLRGNITEDVEILAALSDNSIPFQPEGNTLQLQEFDKVFIQLKKDNNTLIGGDYEIRNFNRSHFLKYQKKLQGARIQNVINIGKGTWRNDLSIASSKGKFNRFQITVQEGNQGPYRLPGNEGERFIIIQAGTERIYLDGQLLVRGLENDYIIDYNSAELTFTANRLITKDSRVIAEYDYSDFNYARSNIALNTNYQTKKLQANISAYIEQDSKNNSGLTDLTPEQRELLSQSGDSPTGIFGSSVKRREEGYDPNIIMYALRDTFQSPDPVLVRSNDPKKAVYTANFSFVGEQNGNYRRVSQEANGEVYAWVAPDSLGMPTGNYAPIVQLFAPQQKQIFSSSIGYEMNEHTKVFSEFSLSNNDKNRFSSIDQDDNIGWAFVTHLEDQRPLGQKWNMQSQLSYEGVEKDYKSINPFRNTEFNRDWNINPEESNQLFQHFVQTSFVLSNERNFQMDYGFDAFIQGDIYKGRKHELNMQWRDSSYFADIQGSLLNNNNSENDFTFFRPKLEVGRYFGKKKDWKVAWYYESEKNSIRSLARDTLTTASFYYRLWRSSISKSANKFLFSTYYQKRSDLRVQDNAYIAITDARDAALQIDVKGNTSSLKGNLTYRVLDLVNEELAGNLSSGKKILGRISHLLRSKNGGLQMTNVYEIGSGQEPKKTFQYIKVEPGKGVYTHIDLNEDGLQQIDEFEIAPFSEQAEYIRVSVIGDEFISTNNLLFNHSLRVDLKKIFPTEKKNGFFQRISSINNIRINKKNKSNDLNDRINPFQLDLLDSNLISTNAQFRSQWFFNKNDPKYDILYEWSDTRNRFILTTGFESKRIRNHSILLRWNFTNALGIRLRGLCGSEIQESESFQNKNYDISVGQFSPEIIWQPDNTFRLNSSYSFTGKSTEGSENKITLDQHEFAFESNISAVKKTNIRTEVSFIVTKLSEKVNPALEFALINGLQDGKNWLWNLSLDRVLVNNIRVNLNYNGRKTGDNQVVHNASVQINAFF